MKIELLQNDLDNANSKLKDYVGRCLKAIEYIEQHNDYFLLKREVKELLGILKGIELTENDKKQVKWLKEEFNVGVDKE